MNYSLQTLDIMKVLKHNDNCERSGVRLNDIYKKKGSFLGI